MNKQERKTMVCCMEFIARNLNDEDDLWRWLIGGVADGDFQYQLLVDNFNGCVDACDESYIDDENFADIMGVFLRCMRRAARPEVGGGLYCDKILDSNR